MDEGNSLTRLRSVVLRVRVRQDRTASCASNEKLATGYAENFALFAIPSNFVVVAGRK